MNTSKMNKLAQTNGLDKLMRLFHRSLLSQPCKRSFSSSNPITNKQMHSIHWKEIPKGPPDAIIGLTEAFLADDFPQKVNVGVGAYRDDDGKPYVLPCVREAEQIISRNKMDHEYAGMVRKHL